MIMLFGATFDFYTIGTTAVCNLQCAVSFFEKENNLYTLRTTKKLEHINSIYKSPQSLERSNLWLLCKLRWQFWLWETILTIWNTVGRTKSKMVVGFEYLNLSTGMLVRSNDLRGLSFWFLDSHSEMNM